MMMSNRSIWLVTLLAVSCVASRTTHPGAPTATIDSGVVVGIQTSLPGSSVLVNKYLNIPYAAPPQRFDIPYRPKPWSSPYNATTVGPACIQQFSYPPTQQAFVMAAFNQPAPIESEDCLNVNVFAPSEPSRGGSLKPVLFWLYGGNLEFGWNSNPVYDGTSFATYQDIILVAANYRTGVFGFPSSPQIPPSQRNLAYWDQRLALDWVQRNARAFGGDPARVTLIGESAGSASVDALVTSFAPPLNPPFHAAIMQSSAIGFLAQNTLYTSDQSWNILLQHLNCSSDQDGLACARAASAASIKNVSEIMQLSYRPVPDNFTYVQYPVRSRRLGEIARVPLLLGTNFDEGTIFTLADTNTSTFLETIVPGEQELQASIAAQYPVPAEFATEQAQIAAIATDLYFKCQLAIVANNSMAAGIPTYRYLYNATFPNVKIIPGLDTGVYHSSELALIFGTYGYYENRSMTTPATANEIAFSQVMQKAWADFAKNPTTDPVVVTTSWDQVPYVQILGGQPDGSINNKTFVQSSTSAALDRRCSLYQDIIVPGGSIAV